MPCGRPPPTLPYPSAARWLLLTLLFPVCLAATLLADGIVIPPVGAAPVTMPDQRALLVWHEKEQTETLVIESRFTGSGHDFAWFVPLPSKPDITPATRGTLPTAAALFRVKLANLADYGPLLIAWIAPWALFVIFLGGTGRQFIRQGWVLIAPTVVLAATGSRFVVSMIGLAIVWRLAGGTAKDWSGTIARGVLTIIGILLILLPAILIPLGVAGSPVGSSAVEVERSIVGDYDVAVLAGGEEGAVARWLHDNHFTLPTTAELVVAEHARAGGYFAAIKLRRTDDTTQPVAPAPLVFTFKTPQAVYPMKLTGAGATRPLAVELYVFGAGQANVDGLKVESCEQAVVRESQDWQMVSASRYILAHPELVKLCGESTVATRLTGTLSPAQMTQDLPIHWQPFIEPVVPGRYSQSDTACLGGLMATAGLLLGALLLVPGRKRWGSDGFPASRMPLILGVAVVLASITAGAGVWFALSSVQELPFMVPRPSTAGADALFKQVGQQLAPGEMTEDRLHRSFQQALEQSARSHGMNPPVESDSPGNYMIRPLPGGHWRLVWYGVNGEEVVTPDSDL
jgi:hypothetical protein